MPKTRSGASSSPSRLSSSRARAPQIENEPSSPLSHVDSPRAPASQTENKPPVSSICAATSRASAPPIDNKPLEGLAESLSLTLANLPDSDVVLGKDAKLLANAASSAITQVWNETFFQTSALALKINEGNSSLSQRLNESFSAIGSRLDSIPTVAMLGSDAHTAKVSPFSGAADDGTQFSIWLRRLEDVIRMRPVPLTVEQKANFLIGHLDDVAMEKVEELSAEHRKDFAAVSSHLRSFFESPQQRLEASVDRSPPDRSLGDNAAKSLSRRHAITVVAEAITTTSALHRHMHQHDVLTQVGLLTSLLALILVLTQRGTPGRAAADRPAGGNSGGHAEAQLDHANARVAALLQRNEELAHPEAECRYVPLGTMMGLVMDNVWISKSKEFALYWTSHSDTVMDCARDLVTTDQGYAIKRARQMPRSADAGLVSSNQLAAQLLAVEGTVQETVSSLFQHAVQALCERTNVLAVALQAALESTHPTLALRALLGRPDITATHLGNGASRGPAPGPVGHKEPGALAGTRQQTTALGLVDHFLPFSPLGFL
ncbi:hypothetical protein Q1695_002699 [Nippostrongylus brasiliensis]|nr:hypothetical protein Q1695_002699 [Nippostrongylus brasiliensis]